MLSVSDRQANNDRTHGLNIVMDHAGFRNGILDKFII